jgi:glucosamine--fructose-6-phosphate aminotransferase (isomerizing)
VFLGSGPFYGIACEGMLKMKEMAIVPSDGFHALEFRHGPKSILDGGALATVFLSDTARDEELRLIREIKELGAAVLTVCEEAPGDVPGGGAVSGSEFLVETGSQIVELARSILYLPAAQLLAFSKAASKDIDVDTPRHLSYHVSL